MSRFTEFKLKPTEYETQMTELNSANYFSAVWFIIAVF